MFGRKPSPGTMLFHRAGAQRKLRRLEGESRATRRELKESRASMAKLRGQVEEMKARLEENARAEAAQKPQVVFPKVAAPELRTANREPSMASWQSAGAWRPGVARPVAAAQLARQEAAQARPKSMREHQVRFLDLNSRAVHGELAEAEAREYSEYLKRGFGRMLARRAG